MSGLTMLPFTVRPATTCTPGAMAVIVTGPTTHQSPLTN